MIWRGANGATNGASARAPAPGFRRAAELWEQGGERRGVQPGESRRPDRAAGGGAPVQQQRRQHAKLPTRQRPRRAGSRAAQRPHAPRREPERRARTQAEGQRALRAGLRPRGTTTGELSPASGRRDGTRWRRRCRSTPRSEIPPRSPPTCRGSVSGIRRTLRSPWRGTAPRCRGSWTRWRTTPIRIRPGAPKRIHRRG